MDEVSPYLDTEAGNRGVQLHVLSGAVGGGFASMLHSCVGSSPKRPMSACQLEVLCERTNRSYSLAALSLQKGLLAARRSGLSPRAQTVLLMLNSKRAHRRRGHTSFEVTGGVIDVGQTEEQMTSNGYRRTLLPTAILLATYASPLVASISAFTTTSMIWHASMRYLRDDC